MVGMLDVDAVLFDMDGTLVDSTAVVEGLWARFASRYGVDLDVLLPYSRGRQTRDTIARFLPAGEDVGAVTRGFESLELQQDAGIREVPGARDLLRSLAHARTAVVTSAPRALALRRLAAAGLPAPRVLVGADEAQPGKPDPTGYLAAARVLGVAAPRCLVVEDAEAGIRAGLAAGAQVLVVGEHRSAATRGLPRVADLRAVSAATQRSGTIQIRWHGDPGPGAGSSSS